MPKPKDWNYHKTITEKHSFFWDSELLEEKMWEISDWIKSLPDTQLNLLSLLIEDIRENCEWNERNH